jgi:hypothetical protein
MASGGGARGGARSWQLLARTSCFWKGGFVTPGVCNAVKQESKVRAVLTASDPQIKNICLLLLLLLFIERAVEKSMDSIKEANPLPSRPRRNPVGSWRPYNSVRSTAAPSLSEKEAAAEHLRTEHQHYFWEDGTEATTL